LVRKVIGRINREMNRDIAPYPGPRSENRTRVRSPRKVSRPQSAGLGPVYREDDDI